MPLASPRRRLKSTRCSRMPRSKTHAQHVPNEDNRHIRLVGQPVTLSRTPSRMAARPPEFGEQTDEVLAEFGFRKDEIAELRQRNVV